MTTRTKRTVVIVAVATIVLSLPVIVSVCWFVSYSHGVFVRAERGRERLFYETDCHELLAACRKVLGRVEQGELKLGQYSVSLHDPAPEAALLPQVILDLEPAFVLIENASYLLVALCPMPDGYGLKAFAEGAEGYEGRGEIELVEGLWYFDAHYRDEYPDYMKKIDSMIEKGRQAEAAQVAEQRP